MGTTYDKSWEGKESPSSRKKKYIKQIDIQDMTRESLWDVVCFLSMFCVSYFGVHIYVNDSNHRIYNMFVMWIEGLSRHMLSETKTSSDSSS